MSEEENTKKEKKGMETGAYDKTQLEYTLPSRGIYDWEKVKETIQEGKVYVLPLGTNRNTVLTALRREDIKARVGTVKKKNKTDPEQIVVVPLP